MMTHLDLLRTKKDGFTLVELAIVIAVIAILALIVLVAYPGYQQRNRDNVRKSDMQQLSAAISTYAIQKNNFVETASGCGIAGDGNGWLSATTADWGTYSAKSIIGCLQDAKVLKAGDFIDPSGCVRDSGGACGTSGGAPVPAYMKVTCAKSGVKTTYLLAYLETQPRIDATIDALCDAGTAPGFASTNWGTMYGMNYYVVVK
jgi:prepilin-type N-terminal cleavage/methylation domain-containing protein